MSDDEVSDEVLRQLLIKARHAVGLTRNILTRYRHAKTGRQYVVLDVALREDDLTPVVVYRPAADEDLRRVRPLPEFLDGRFVPEGV